MFGGGNKDIQIDEWSYNAGQCKKGRVTTKVGELSKRTQNRRL